MKFSKSIICVLGFILIFILPALILSLWLFSNTEVPIEKEINSENITFFPNLDKLTTPTTKNNLRQLLQVPFDINNYEVCIYQGQSKIVHSNGNYDNVGEMKVVFSNESIIIPPKTERCITRKLSNNLTFSISYESEIKIQNTKKSNIASITIEFDHLTNNPTEIMEIDNTDKVTFQPEMKLTIKYPFNEKIILIFLTIISIMGLILLINSARDFVLEKFSLKK